MCGCLRLYESTRVNVCVLEEEGDREEGKQKNIIRITMTL